MENEGDVEMTAAKIEAAGAYNVHVRPLASQIKFDADSSVADVVRQLPGVKRLDSDQDEWEPCGRATSYGHG